MKKMLLEKYLLLLLTLTVRSDGCMRTNVEEVQDIRVKDDLNGATREVNNQSMISDLKRSSSDARNGQSVSQMAGGFQQQLILDSPEGATEYPLTRVPRSTPYLGRDWEQIIPYGPAPLSPTTPMSPYNSSSPNPLGRRKHKLLQVISPQKQGAIMTHELGGILRQSRRRSHSSRSLLTPEIEEDPMVAEGTGAESTKVSLQLTVLDAFAPTTIIRRPNVHRPWESQAVRRRRRLNTKNRFRLVFPNQNRTSRHIGISKHPKFGKNLRRELKENSVFKHEVGSTTSRQTISIGLNVLPFDNYSATIAANAKIQPHAAPLKQAVDFWEVTDEDNSFSFLELDEEMVCQIHRCEEYADSADADWRPVSPRPSLAIDMEIDFHVGTNILKDIWNNHINADKMIGLKAVDEVNEANEGEDELEGVNFEEGNEDPHLSGKKNFASSNTSTTSQEFQSDVANQYGQNNLVNLKEFASSSRDETSVLSSTNNEFLSEKPVRDAASFSHIHALNLDASTVNAAGELSNEDAHKFFTLPQNLAALDLGGLVPSENEEPTANSVFVHNLISPEESVTDFFVPTGIDPVSTHLLPPSVLPAILADAVEGRVVQSGHKTRIVLRLKPSGTYPSGEIVVVPASKFDKFGTADIVLDSGRKISVKLKSNSPTSLIAGKDSKPKSVFQNENVDVSYDLSGDNVAPELATPHNIPLTILRDAVSGAPVMVMPGLTPNTNSLLRWQDLRSAENTPSVSQSLELPQPHQFQASQTFNPNLNLVPASKFVNPSLSNLNSQGPTLNNINFQDLNMNSNAFVGPEVPSSIFGQNFATMTSRLQSGIRNLMDRVSGVTSRMEENVVGSFQNSVDFLRVFYENVLPENYSDDSMTMISIAAFLAFLGARLSDITSALGASAVGRNTLGEVEKFLGKDISRQVEEFFSTLRDSKKLEDALEDNSGRNLKADPGHTRYNREKLMTGLFHQSLFSDSSARSSPRDVSRDPHLTPRQRSDNLPSAQHPNEFIEPGSRTHTEKEQNDPKNSSENVFTDQEFYDELLEVAALWRQHLDKLSLGRQRSLPCVQRELCFLNTAGVRKGGFSAFITPIISVGVAAAHSAARGALVVLDALRPLWMAQSSTDSSACEAIICLD